MVNFKPSKVYPYKGQIAPQSVAAAGNVTGNWIDASQCRWLSGTLLVGAGGGTVALKIEQATSAAGAGAKDLYTAAQLGITAQGVGQVQFDAQLDCNLDVANGFRWVRANATVTGGTGTLVSVGLIGGPSEFMN